MFFFSGQPLEIYLFAHLCVFVCVEVKELRINVFSGRTVLVMKWRLICRKRAVHMETLDV